ncbi:MAG TPA: hypothetical protein VIO59_13415 [Rhodanobacter sp.]
MMPPRNRSSVLPAQTIQPMPESVIFAPASLDEILPSHVDCNLHPLLVHNLDHYVIVDDKGERFYAR